MYDGFIGFEVLELLGVGVIGWLMVWEDVLVERVVWEVGWEVGWGWCLFIEFVCEVDVELVGMSFFMIVCLIVGWIL